MNQQQIEEYKALIKAPERVQAPCKVDCRKRDVEIMLDLTYQEIVSRRRIDFQDNQDYTSQIKMVAEWLTGNHRPGLLLYGNYGAGKTSMGKAICLLISVINKKVVWPTTARELCNLAASDKDAFQDLKKQKMLYIDEVGREQLVVQNFGNKINPFVEVLEYRYDRQMFTILTANLTEEEIIDRYGIYIHERIEENFDKINYTNPSYRTGS